MIFSRKAARTGVILFPLLGLTWMIGFVALPLSYVWPKYIFVILNSLQVSHRVEWFNDLFTNTNVDVLVIPGGGVGNIMAELLFNLVDVENVISFPFFVSSCGSFSHVFISSCDVFFFFFQGMFVFFFNTWRWDKVSALLKHLFQPNSRVKVCQFCLVHCKFVIAVNVSQTITVCYNYRRYIFYFLSAVHSYDLSRM